MDIKKIVRLEPDQYMKLLKKEPVEVNGELKTLEDGVLYDTGYREFIEWYNKIMEAQYKQVEVAHTPVAMKSLEQEYEELTNGIDGKASKNVSAIGYTAILKKGDTVKVTLPNYGAFFINGERVTNDYTYNGDGYEVVNVWCFEGKSNPNDPMELTVPPRLEDTPTFNITELNVRCDVNVPVVGEGYTNFALTLKTYNAEVSGVATKKLISTGTDEFKQRTVSSLIEEVESSCTTFPDSGHTPLGKTTLKKAYFPELTHINSGNTYNGFLNGASNPNLEINFPKLRVIRSAGNSGRSNFNKVYKVILPKSVEYVGAYCCNDNKVIILNCNRAEFAPNWCYKTPTENFQMCENWQTSIDITVAAIDHSVDLFIDLFTNKLHDFYADYKDIIDDPSYSGEVPLKKFITIPKNTYDLLSATEEGKQALEIASNKYWQVEFPAT